MPPPQDSDPTGNNDARPISDSLSTMLHRISMDLQEYKEWLRGIWMPAIAVVASEDAERMCWDNSGMTLTEFLRPFGQLRQMNSGLGGMDDVPAFSVFIYTDLCTCSFIYFVLFRVGDEKVVRLTTVPVEHVCGEL